MYFYSMTDPVKTDLRQLELETLRELLTEWKEPAFRARQVYAWLWERSARSIEEMTNLSKSLRARLAEAYEIRAASIDHTQHSSDGTIKNRILLHDGLHVEAVLIPVPDQNRYTLCVSSQVGCSLSCAFCATGRMKRMRNLEAGEIYDQYALVNAQCEEVYNHPLTNVVYMGMGEPLLNYQQVTRSIDRLTASDGLNISPKRITVSTVGIAKMIRRLADDHSKCNLALSLHAADDIKRSEIMPINDQNNIAVLMDALAYYYRQTGNRISYEYIAFEGMNDSLEDARALAALCRRFPVRINIIEYNPIPGLNFTKSDPGSIDTFARSLRAEGIMVTVRRSRGKDIDAACGQLIVSEEDLSS